jgi:Flp pilus assembly protein TadD
LGPLQNREAAFDFAKRARDLLPADPYVADLLGRIVFQMQNFRWAYSLLQEAARRLNNDPSVVRDFAWSSYSVGKMDDARRLMQIVGGLHPDGEVASDAANFLRVTSTGVAPADADVEGVLNKQPHYIPALMAKAQRHPDPKAAAGLYQEVLDQWPDFPLAQKFLAALYAEEPTKTDAAFDLALKARNSLIDDPELAQTLGVISYRKNEFPYAVQCFEEIARKRPLSARELFYLGMALLRMSRDRESRETLETAIRAGLPEPMMNEAKAVVADLRTRSSAN